jgi:CheY-like chemotaxis protein
MKSDDLQEKELVQHHHYIACKNYDKTIMNKLNSFRNIDLLTQSIRKDRLKKVRKNSLKTEKIMLVDDEDDIVMLFKLVLESNARLKVDSFTDPFAALNNFRSGVYDLILIDIALPKMDGFELYYKIRKLDTKVKICFLTAGEMYYEEIRKEAFPELDTNCFIKKPVANEDLMKSVKGILEIQ